MWLPGLLSSTIDNIALMFPELMPELVLVRSLIATPLHLPCMTLTPVDAPRGVSTPSPTPTLDVAVESSQQSPCHMWNNPIQEERQEFKNGIWRTPSREWRGSTAREKGEDSGSPNPLRSESLSSPARRTPSCCRPRRGAATASTASTGRPWFNE